MQILVQHIKTLLPGLKSRISTALVSVAKEHASYGEITESKAGLLAHSSFHQIVLEFTAKLIWRLFPSCIVHRFFFQNLPVWPSSLTSSLLSTKISEVLHSTSTGNTLSYLVYEIIYWLLRTRQNSEVNQNSEVLCLTSIGNTLSHLVCGSRRQGRTSLVNYTGVV